MTASTRVLRLLSLLQARREWSGAELSESLEVDVRTIRRDANRLRDLGYAIESSAGPGGGYRLAAGTRTPPLLLDDKEVLTVAIALTAVAGTLGDFTDTALSVLVKLDQLSPNQLKRKWNALKRVTLSLADERRAPSSNLLAQLAAACRDERRIVFKYGDRTKRETLRDVEPMRLVHTGHVWYLVAWDTHREDWRTFRLDRIDPSVKLRLGPRFAPREPPMDFATLVARAISTAPYSCQARLKLSLACDEAKRRIPPWVGVLEPLNERQTILTLGAESYDGITALIVHAGLEFELIEPPEMAAPIRRVAALLARGVRRKKKLLKSR